MKNKGKLSKRTLGLLAATLVLVLATGGMGARAALSIFSQDYNAEFEMDHLDVALIENGEIAGEKDPVGENGKGVRRVYDMFRRAEMQDVEIRLYPEYRHEILNELNKEEVMKDVLDWLDARAQKASA